MATFYKPAGNKRLLNQTLELSIERLNHDAVAVARYQKKAIFVDGALPNERVKVKVVEQNSKFIKAKLIAITQASDERENVACRHFSMCGGCNLQHLNYLKQLEFKQQKVTELFARAGISANLPWLEPITTEPYGYRRKVRIGAQYNKHGEAIVGFRQKKSNALVSIDTCPVMTSNISQLFPQLKLLIDKLAAHQSVGHIEVIESNKISLVIRQLVNMPDSDKSLWLNFAKQHDYQLFIDNGKTISAFSSISEEPVINNYPLDYDLDNEIKIYFSPEDFIQVNHEVNKKMVSQALNWLSLSANDKVLDLFCGLGNFTLPIAKQVDKVVGVEGVLDMVEKADYNAKQNHINNAVFFHADLNTDWRKSKWFHQTQAYFQQPFNVLVLDPARAGALEAIANIQPFKLDKILYISCEPASLARDSAVLMAQGYHMVKIALLDMFAQTKHVETMVLFEPQQ